MKLLHRVLLVGVVRRLQKLHGREAVAVLRFCFFYRIIFAVTEVIELACGFFTLLLFLDVYGHGLGVSLLCAAAHAVGALFLRYLVGDMTDGGLLRAHRTAGAVDDILKVGGKIHVARVALVAVGAVDVHAGSNGSFGLFLFSVALLAVERDVDVAARHVVFAVAERDIYLAVGDGVGVYAHFLSLLAHAVTGEPALALDAGASYGAGDVVYGKVGEHEDYSKQYEHAEDSAHHSAAEHRERIAQNAADEAAAEHEVMSALGADGVVRVAVKVAERGKIIDVPVLGSADYVNERAGKEHC